MTGPFGTATLLMANPRPGLYSFQTRECDSHKTTGLCLKYTIYCTHRNFYAVHFLIHFVQSLRCSKGYVSEKLNHQNK